MHQEDLEDRARRLEAGCAMRRNRRIDQLVSRAKRHGEDPDRLFWSIVHDLEHAPMTSYRARLEEMGVQIPIPGRPLRVGVSEARALLDDIVQGLAMVKVFVDLPCDVPEGRLLRAVIDHLLDERIPDLPSCLGVRTWVSPCGGGFSIRSECLPGVDPDRRRIG